MRSGRSAPAWRVSEVAMPNVVAAWLGSHLSGWSIAGWITAILTVPGRGGSPSRA